MGSNGGRGIHFVRYFLLGEKRRCEVIESWAFGGWEPVIGGHA